jgi:CubicO group peptidase (beta-lactamase class C family)
MTPPPAWLAPAVAYIPQWLGYQMRVTEQPGCALAIAHDGAIVHESAYGHADLAAGIKLTSRHRFRVASHSKSFTAAGMMKLREQGRLKLDDTAGQYVEGLHPAIATATIAQLISHTAGIFRDGTDCGYWSERVPFADEARIRADLTLPPAIDSNTRLKYSNHGFALAGLVMEAITGEPYNTWMQREIIAPAGLSETTPDVPIPARAKLARGHGTKLVLGRRPVLSGEQSTFALTAATGFVSTAADLAKWFAQLVPNAPTSVLSAASRREMTRPQWRDAYSTLDRSYGLGIITGAFDGWSWFGHSGGFPGYITQSATFPEQRLTISVLTNAADGMSHMWLEGIAHILKRFADGGAPGETVADWSGRWWSLWGANDFVPVGDRVLVALPGMLKPLLKVAELEVSGADEARISQAGAFGNFGEPVRRLRNKAGKMTSVRYAGMTLLTEAALAKELGERYGDAMG